VHRARSPDIILRSRDLVDFHCYTEILAAASDFVVGMLYCRSAQCRELAERGWRETNSTTKSQ
jgi:hypothetical protein